MAKIDFTKVEQQLSIGIQSIFVKNLMQGKATVSTHAVSYYGLDQGARPKPQDSVIEGLKELEIVESEAEEQEIKEKDAATIPTTEKVPVSDDARTPPSPLFLLDQHLSWFKKKKVKDAYKFLGTSSEELEVIREKKTRTEADEARIAELLAKAKQAKGIVLKKLGLHEDEAIVEKERKKHLTKRFNIRESWLPL